jgi:hypothetical protein
MFVCLFYSARDEPRVLRLLSKHSTIELYPQPELIAFSDSKHRRNSKNTGSFLLKKSSFVGCPFLYQEEKDDTKSQQNLSEE